MLTYLFFICLICVIPFAVAAYCVIKDFYVEIRAIDDFDYQYKEEKEEKK